MYIAFGNAIKTSKLDATTYIVFLAQDTRLSALSNQSSGCYGFCVFVGIQNHAIFASPFHEAF